MDYENPVAHFSLFEVSAPFVRKSLYLSLGILGLLIIIGIVWDACIRRKSTEAKEKVELGERFVTTCNHRVFSLDLQS